MTDAVWEKLTVRLKQTQFQILRDAAFKSKLPVAVFARQMLTGEVPPAAPPPINELTPDCAQLLRCAYSVVSNSTQLSQIAQVLGEPFSQLSGESGVLSGIAAQARQLGLQVKQGAMAESTATQILSPNFVLAIDQFNRLARDLNSGHAVAGGVWQDVLGTVRKAMSAAIAFQNAQDPR